MEQQQTPRARATEIRGIDVSKYQGAIDWRKVAASGIRFAFVRTGWAGYEGGIEEGFDPRFVENITGARAAGLGIGAYLYSYLTSPGPYRRRRDDAAGLSISTGLPDGP